MPNIDYTTFYATKGKPYSSTTDRSYYNTPIDRSSGRLAGNSRIWGDAPQETQKAAIDSILIAAKDRGLSTRETAHVLAIARHESGFNPDAAAGSSSASGLGQFIKKTGTAYNLTDTNRWNMQDQAEALVDHFVENRDETAKRGLGEDYIYALHHDGPRLDSGGLDISKQKVIPRIDSYEAALKAGGAQSSTTGTSSVPANPHQAPPEQNANSYLRSPSSDYTIQSGDSLSKIAARHGVSGRRPPTPSPR